MKILIVSYETWTDETNGGNVLSNIFSSFPKDTEFAQIYCSSGLPNNKICKNYLQLSDYMMIGKQKVGKIINGSSSEVENQISTQNKKFFRNTKLLIRDFIWGNKKWKKSVKEFVLSFDPDVIFMPCYAFPHMLRIDLFIHDICKAPILSYISDDCYGFRSFPWPAYLVFQIKIRNLMRSFLKLPIITYTMTEKQLEEYSNKFGIRMKILRKTIPTVYTKNPGGQTLKFIYAGGGYLGRDKVLYTIIKNIQKYQEQGNAQVEFCIYSNSIRKNIKNKIDKINFVNVSNSIPFNDLIERYHNSNVALHVESFNYFSKKSTRLSYSTKINDCLSSGCIPFVVGPGSNAGISFLKENELGICCTNKKHIKDYIYKIFDFDKALCIKKNIVNFARANLIGMNHMLYNDFSSIVQKNKNL